MTIFSNYLTTSMHCDRREVVSAYAWWSRQLFRELMEAALEALGIGDSSAGEVLADCDAGSQMLMVNCFPACPEPELTLGMPPHSDYGFLTVLLQDQVNGLEIWHDDRWVLVDPLPGSLVVNIGDHFEVYYSTSTLAVQRICTLPYR